jgi:FMN phosphatase YigB (HAD superfamily)
MISFAYFDVGGVVIKDFSNTHKWEEMIEGFGAKGENLSKVQSIFERYGQKFCVGCNFDSMLPIINQETSLNIPGDYSLMKDMVNRFEVNESIWQVIEKVHKKVRVGLLTNMYPGMFKAIDVRGLLPPVKWDEIIDSSIEKCQKPEIKIFEIAAKRCGEKPENILFIDNGAMHVEAAKKLGFRTFRYDSGDYEGASKELNNFMGEQVYTSEVSRLHHLGGVNL